MDGTLVWRTVCLPFLIIAMVVLGRGQLTTGTPANTGIEQEIINIEAQKDHAMQTREMDVLDRIYADGLVFVNTRGQVLTKAERMAEFQSESVKYLSFEQGDYHFHIYGDTVVMTGRASSVVDYHGKVNRIPRRFTSVYVKLHGQWQLVAHQATLITKH
jgi:ketosteroid isomerase-like protein